MNDPLAKAPCGLTQLRARAAMVSILLCLFVVSVPSRSGSAQSGVGSTPTRTRSIDPATFRGSNYLPGSSLGLDAALALLTARQDPMMGTYNHDHVEAEIAKFATAGLDVLRVFPSFYGWLVDQNDYMANLGHLAATCRRHGIRMTYVVWNTTSNVFFPLHDFVQPGFAPTDPGLLSTVQFIASSYSTVSSPVPLTTVQSEFGEPWQFVLHDEPGNRLFDPPYDGVMSSWPNNLGAKCVAYVDAIGRFFASESAGRAAYASYDLFNESDCCNLQLDSQSELYRMTYSRLLRQHQLDPEAPRAQFTAGFADYNRIADYNDFLVNIGIQQDYLSYHCYAEPGLFSVIANVNGLLGQTLGLPVVCSEFYDRNRPGHLGSLGAFMDTLRRRGIGANMWGYMSANLVITLPRPPFNAVRLDGVWIPRITPMGPLQGPSQSPLNSNVQFDLAAGSEADLQALGYSR